MAIYYSFDTPSLSKAEQGEDKTLWRTTWQGEWASQSPLNTIYQSARGGGANGSPGYLALPGQDSDQFYAESTPAWWTHRTAFDVRGTYATFYLKEIEPISVAEGYRPHLFIAEMIPGDPITGWYAKTPLTVGASHWALNEVLLLNDEQLWLRYAGERSLDQVLTRTGFIGVMYLNGVEFRGVGANGVLGIDEFTYHLRELTP